MVHLLIRNPNFKSRQELLIYDNSVTVDQSLLKQDCLMIRDNAQDEEIVTQQSSCNENDVSCDVSRLSYKLTSPRSNTSWCQLIKQILFVSYWVVFSKKINRPTNTNSDYTLGKSNMAFIIGAKFEIKAVCTVDFCYTLITTETIIKKTRKN